jgi:hypothetical protein
VVRVVNGLLKAFEIKAVIRGLLETEALMASLTDFEFDGKNDLGHNYNGATRRAAAGKRDFFTANPRWQINLRASGLR